MTPSVVFLRQRNISTLRTSTNHFACQNTSRYDFMLCSLISKSAMWSMRQGDLSKRAAINGNQMHKRRFVRHCAIASSKRLLPIRTHQSEIEKYLQRIQCSYRHCLIVEIKQSQQSSKHIHTSTQHQICVGVIMWFDETRSFLFLFSDDPSQ